MQSALYVQSLLDRWSRRYKFNIGQHSYKGFALFAEPGRFVVEHRGPGFQPFRHEYPYTSEHNKINYNDRHYQFQRAKELLTRLRQCAQ